MVLMLIVFKFLFATSMASTLILEHAENLRRLIKEHDHDSDKKITIDDLKINKDESFELKLLDGNVVEIQGSYFLSNLLQELKLLTEKSGAAGKIEKNIIFENPVDRISRKIREDYWDGLTRRIDKDHLKKVLRDPKIQTQFNYLYVSEKDKVALSYFKKIESEMPELKMKVEQVPHIISQDFLKNIEGKHGLLSLEIGTPYVVPGGRFNELYGWDSYFETIGLLIDGRVDLAKGMVDNQVYEINHFGKILNANRTYYLSRSQPPFLTSMIRAVLEKLPKNNETKVWLKKSLLAAIEEYQNVWMGKDHLTSIGLSRYYGKSPEVPPEVEPGHFNHIFEPYARKYGLSTNEFEKRYRNGIIVVPDLDEFFIHDQAIRESGHDTTFRWQKNHEDKCSDFVTIDLNALLYKIELDVAFLIKNFFNGNLNGLTSKYFFEKADKRKKLIRQYLWNKKDLFHDYDFVSGKSSAYITATAFYPLWTYEHSDPSTRILTYEEANNLIVHLLSQLETNGGITATALSSLSAVGGKINERQWEYPNGWAPHQMILWEGLKRYSQTDHLNRLIYKWLFMITKNARDYNGTIPEKYDVVGMTHKVFSEYGNVGTKFSYITREGFGWMNASCQLGLSLLPNDLKRKLKMLVPPDHIWTKLNKRDK